MARGTKIGRRAAEELICGGNLYTGRQLYDMGVVDVLAPDGAGEAAVYSFIKKHAKAGNGRRAIEMVRREIDNCFSRLLAQAGCRWIDNEGRGD